MRTECAAPPQNWMVVVCVTVAGCCWTRWACAARLQPQMRMELAALALKWMCVVSVNSFRAQGCKQLMAEIKALSTTTTCTSGVCAGQGTSCLGLFQFLCEVTLSGGTTLAQISESTTVITELQTVVTTALGIPTTLIQNIQVSVPNITESLRQLQNDNQTLDIAVVMYQDTATQPIGNQDVLSTVCVVERSHFSIK